MTAFASVIAPKQPTTRGWVRARGWVAPPGLVELGYPVEAWAHPANGLFVLSAVEKPDPQPGEMDLGPEYHLSISKNGQRCSSADAVWVLAQFDLIDAKEDKWWRRFASGQETVVPKRGGEPYQRTLYSQHALSHPRKVWKHYYALPRDIWKPELLECLPSPASGVILFSERRGSVVPVVAEVERRATPNNDATRLKPEEVMDLARLANLRMWEAYRQRDAARVQADEARASAVPA